MPTSRIVAANIPTLDNLDSRVTDLERFEVTRDFLLDYSPKIVIPHAGGTNGARYQLPMWLPFVERVGFPFVVAVAFENLVPVAAKLTKRPVIWVPTDDQSTMDMVFADSVKVAFYVRNTKLNRPYLARRSVTHVFLNHGDSDKSANARPTHKRFNKIFVCGEAGVERYQSRGVELPASRFEIIGRPQTEGIEFNALPLRRIQEPTVLYAPTWRGVREADRFTSLPVGTELVTQLLNRGARVIFRPHPLSRKPEEIAHVEAVIRLLKEHRKVSGREHVWGNQAEKVWSVKDCINASDALVSDVSSVVTDYLASGKPYALIAMIQTADEFREQFFSARSGYVLEKDLSNVDVEFDKMFGYDPLSEARIERRMQTLGGLTGEEASQRFVEATRALVARGVTRARRANTPGLPKAKNFPAIVTDERSVPGSSVRPTKARAMKSNIRKILRVIKRRILRAN